MDLKTLFDDDRISIRNADDIDRNLYNSLIKRLRTYKFWQSPVGKDPSLWDHQQAAVAMLAAYLSSNRSLPVSGIENEAALVKMATGAGKSAVITVLCRCFPQVKRVLVVTPRVALTDQIYQYIRSKFWITMGFDTSNPKSLFVDEDGAVTGAKVDAAYVERLLPSSVDGINNALGEQDRAVIVGTLQGLSQIRRESIKQFSDDESQNDRIRAAQEFLLKLNSSFDLVIVDEGHYEPAVSWSRAIRDADLPTVLFSATPYRNDYKSFRVKGRFVFNQSAQEALSKRIIRVPEFESLDVADADIDPPELAAKKSTLEEEVEDSGNDRELTDAEKSDAQTFAKALASRLTAVPVPDGLEHWKIIIRAERLPKLKVLQQLIEDYTGEKALVIHHAVERVDSARRHFKRVKQAQDSEASESVRFWLHETKLLEGVDDPSFVAVAVYDGFANARQLIQQIGRVLRSSDSSRRSDQRAIVLAAPRHMAAIEASWARYLEFEAYCAENTERVVISEAALPERVMEAMPDLQYIEGEFRPRYMRDGALTIDDIQLPASAAVFVFAAPEFDADTIRQEISEAILSNDRFQPMRIGSLPDNTVAVAYYGWRTSPWLRHQYFAEWTFGLCVVTKVGTLVFAHDTSGIVFDSSKLAMTRLDQNDLMLAIPKSTEDRKVRVMRMSAASLDMSERAIRAQATRTSSFEDTFTDLLDPGMFPTSAYGRVGLYGRYLGFTQGRVRDGKPNLLPLKDYLKWTEELAGDLAEIGSSSNPVFNRYAQLASPPSKKDAQPLNVLIDLGDSFEDFRGNKDGQPLRELMLDIETPDLCSDVNEDGKFEVQISGSPFPCQITYNSANHRYKVSSDELDRFFHAASPSGRKSAQTFTEMLNRIQSFRVIPKAAGIVYANGKFYRPQGLGRRPDGSFPQLDNVIAIPLLGDLTTEKGEKLYPNPEWRKQSQFGAIKTICEADDATVLPESYGKLGEELRKFDLVICDDDGQEIGDFLAIDTDRRLVCIIHAKASKEPKHAAVSALQEVGRQALASLAFCSTVAVAPKVSAERWGTDVTANDKVLTGLNRIFRNTKHLTVDQARTTMLEALNNRAWDKEIWVVVARMLNRTTFEARLKNDDRNLTMQTSMYLASLTTSCARANARLKIFCHESNEKDDLDARDAES